MLIYLISKNVIQRVFTSRRSLINIPQRGYQAKHIMFIPKLVINALYYLIYSLFTFLFHISFSCYAYLSHPNSLTSFIPIIRAWKTGDGNDNAKQPLSFYHNQNQRLSVIYLQQFICFILYVITSFCNQLIVIMASYLTVYCIIKRIY